MLIRWCWSRDPCDRAEAFGKWQKAKGAHSERQIPCVYSCILRVYNTHIRVHGVCSLGRYIDVSFVFWGVFFFCTCDGVSSCQGRENQTRSNNKVTKFQK